MSTQVSIDALALLALGGKVMKVQHDQVAAIIDQFPELGGLKLEHTGAEIVEKAIRGFDEDQEAKITFIVVTKERAYGDIHIALVIDTTDRHYKDIADLLYPGYALSYVYNVSATWCSEHGDIFFAYGEDGKVHRVG